jgi:hypothetical protein
MRTEGMRRDENFPLPVDMSEDAWLPVLSGSLGIRE